MEVIYFNNLKFVKDKKSGYYRNSTTRERLHRYIYEYYKGKIEKNCEIHHIDFNKENNDISNLQMLTKKEHKKIHKLLTEKQKEKRKKNLEINARPKAIEWHKSEEGRKLAKELYEKYGKYNFTKREEMICQNCGNKFIGISKKSKYCSNKCKSAYRRKKGDDNIERKCERCGEMFIVNKYYKTKKCKNCTY